MMTRLRGMLVAVGAALVVAACSGSGASTAPSVAESAAPGPIRIGYISGGETDPFVHLVTEGLREEAPKLGVELAECDSAFDQEKALACGRTLGASGLASVINWQFFPESAQEVCEAYGNLPTVAIDTPEDPCQKTFIGADNHGSGLIGGKALGDFAKAKFECQYDAYISLDIPTAPAVNDPRAGGAKEGFEGVCGPIPADKYHSVDVDNGGPDQPANSRRQVADILTALPDAKTILLISPAGDSMAAASLGAADVAGRKDQVWVVTMGADPSVRDEIRSEPQWVGSVGYFPEKYAASALPLAIALAKGETVPPEVLTEHQLINAANIDDFYPLP